MAAEGKMSICETALRERNTLFSKGGLVAGVDFIRWRPYTGTGQSVGFENTHSFVGGSYGF